MGLSASIRHRWWAVEACSLSAMLTYHGSVVSPDVSLHSFLGGALDGCDPTLGNSARSLWFELLGSLLHENAGSPCDPNDLRRNGR